MSERVRTREGLIFTHYDDPPVPSFSWPIHKSPDDDDFSMVILRLTTIGREGLPTLVFSNKNEVMAVYNPRSSALFRVMVDGFPRTTKEIRTITPVLRRSAVFLEIFFLPNKKC